MPIQSLRNRHFFRQDCSVSVIRRNRDVFLLSAMRLIVFSLFLRASLSYTRNE
jgi:hypothetical protein